MRHQHLLPGEIDLLVEHDVTSDVAPLETRAAECDTCRSRVDEARQLVDTLEQLARFAPSPSFAGRVMADVAVVEPWYVTLADVVRRAAPRNRAMHLLLGVSAVATATAFTTALVWLAFHADVAAYLAGEAARRVRAGAASALASAVHDLFGPAAAQFLASARAGGIAIGAAALVVFAAIAALGLRRAAAGARMEK